ncbi:MAG: alpha/beta hydrolase [Nitrospirota bacterium]
MSPETIQKTVKAGGCEINTLKAGSSKGKDILLLHGMSFQAETWRDLGTLGVLGGAGYDVTAIDMPGFGRTKKCGAGPDAVLLKFFEAEGLRKPVMIGPSMGGRTALNFALDHPELVGGLVLIGCVSVEENRDRLHTIGVPTLIVWGEKDHIAPMSNAELLHREIKGARLLVIAGARHPAYLDNPQLWHTELLDFLKANYK